MKDICLIIFFLMFFAVTCTPQKGADNMKIESSVFKDGGMIPEKYTCDGEDISPPLSWSGVPQGTVSLALICDDPDAPAGTWVHWVLYNIPHTAAGIAEAVSSEKKLSDGSLQGINDFRTIGYGGPCPPSGTHRYYFKLYALDLKPELEPGATKWQIVQAMKGHVLSEAQLMAKYKR